MPRVAAPGLAAAGVTRESRVRGGAARLFLRFFVARRAPRAADVFFAAAEVSSCSALTVRCPGRALARATRPGLLRGGRSTPARRASTTDAIPGLPIARRACSGYARSPREELAGLGEGAFPHAWPVASASMSSVPLVTSQVRVRTGRIRAERATPLCRCVFNAASSWTWARPGDVQTSSAVPRGALVETVRSTHWATSCSSPQPGGRPRTRCDGCSPR